MLGINHHIGPHGVNLITILSDIRYLEISTRMPDGVTLISVSCVLHYSREYCIAVASRIVI